MRRSPEATSRAMVPARASSMLMSPDAVLARTDPSATPTWIFPDAALMSTSPLAWPIRIWPDAEWALTARPEPIVTSPLATWASTSPSTWSRSIRPEAVWTETVPYRPVASTVADAVRAVSDEPVGTVTVIAMRRRLMLRICRRSGVSTASERPESRTVVSSAISRASSSRAVTSTVLVAVSAATTVMVPEGALIRRSTGSGVSKL